MMASHLNLLKSEFPHPCISYQMDTESQRKDTLARDPKMVSKEGDDTRVQSHDL